MFLRFTRPALVGLVTALGAAAALPVVASASISPTLTMSGDNAAGMSPASMGFDAGFAPSSGDSAKDVRISFPPGLLANHNIDNGACITATPVSACQISTSGSATIDGTPGVPVAAYLVAAPSAGEISGLEVVSQSAPLFSATGAITLRTTPDTGLNITFTNLPPGLDALDITLSDLRLPSSCPATPAHVTITADSQLASGTTATATAPLALAPGSCASLAYSPTLSAAITKDARDDGAAIVTTVTQAAGESASRSIEFDLPPSLSPNAADLGCLSPTSSSGCRIGTAAAVSPLVPLGGALAKGTVTLGGTVSPLAATITISFPSPLAISLVGSVSLLSNSVTFTNVPDIPLTSLVLTLNGGPGGAKAFDTTCAAGSLVGKFMPQYGTATKTVPAAITYAGCGAPATPAATATGTVAGLAAGHPRLSLKVRAGAGSALVSSLSVGPPSGLGFDRKAIATTKKCTGGGKQRNCTATVTIKGLSAGAISRVSVTGGHLVLTFKKAVRSATVTLASPLLTETAALQSRVKKHRVTTLTATVKVTNARHATRSIPVRLKV